MPGIYALGHHSHIVDGSTWLGSPGWISQPVLTQPGSWISLSVGSYAVYAVRADGTLWGWGVIGRLGVGSSDTSTLATITQIGTDTDWVSVAANDRGAVALKSNGDLFGWGSDYLSGLGSNEVFLTVPTLLPGQWKYVASTSLDTLAIATNGALWAWGTNNGGVHGRGDYDSQWTPTISDSSSWSKVSVWREYAAGIKDDGSLWSWGDGPWPIGDGNSGIGAEPSPVHIAVGQTWADVACGAGHKLAIRSDGTLWSWGYNNYGELGHGGPINNASTPTQIGSDSDWVSVRAGAYASFGIKTDGSLWGWGLSGSCGVSSENDNVLSPVMLTAEATKYAECGFNFNYDPVMMLGADLSRPFWTNLKLATEVQT